MNGFIKNFADIFTFSRSSGGGRINASGQFEWVAANQPRFDYDPVTLAAKGLLIEEQRTNLFSASELPPQTYSENGVTFTVVGSGSVGGITYFDISYAGTLTNYWFAAFDVIPFDQSATAGPKCVSFSFSHLSKAGEEHAIYAVTAGMIADDGWRDYTVTANIGCSVGELKKISGIDNRNNAQVTRGYIVVDGVSVGRTVSGVFRVWERQVEDGSFPTSYIPTSGAQVTRAADVCQINTLTPWFNAVEGALIIEASTSTPQAYGFAFEGRGANGMAAGFSVGTGFTSSKATINVRMNGSAENEAINSSAFDGRPHKFGAAYGATTASMAYDGVVVTSNNAPVVNLPTAFYLGSRGGSGNFWNGHIRKLRFDPRRPSDSQLQSRTV